MKIVVARGKEFRVSGPVYMWQHRRGLPYFGQCFKCGLQFMSDRDRLYHADHVKFCERCVGN
jgi:hypothetical protein